MKQFTSRRPIAGRRRRAVKQEVIIETLRQEIALGQFRSGDNLPKQQELSRRFKVSVVTVQRAMYRLAQEGFIETRYSLGTFVVDHPPHLNHYALIFYYDPSDLGSGGWSHFYAALVNEANRIQQSEKRRIECFYGIDGRTDSVSYRRLLAKMKSHQFAGLIFAASPHSLIGTPLLEWEGVPRVGMMTHNPIYVKIPAVQFELAPWFEKALDYLASRGRKRIAFVSKPEVKPLIESECPPALLSARGLITRPYWNLVLPTWAPAAKHSVHLLMLQEGERPDALVITDDNVVEPTVAGLMAAGVRVPDDVEVVAHANFPRSGPRVLPLKWLGYDTREALQNCVAIIDQQRRGETVPGETRVAPVFEAELAARTMSEELVPQRGERETL